MSCIDPELIQKYIDEEAGPEERVMIEDHIKHCKTCASKISNQRELLAHVKNALNLLVEEPVDIPEFKIPQSRKKRQVIRSRRLIYSVAAACIIILLIVFSPDKEPVVENSNYYMQIVEQEYDANRSLSEQNLIIEVIDPEGNLTEYYLD